MLGYSLSPAQTANQHSESSTCRKQSRRSSSKRSCAHSVPTPKLHHPVKHRRQGWQYSQRRFRVALRRAQIGSFTDSRGLLSVAQDTELSPSHHCPGLRDWDNSPLRILLRGTLQRFPEPNPRGNIVHIVRPSARQGRTTDAQVSINVPPRRTNVHGRPIHVHYWVRSCVLMARAHDAVMTTYLSFTFYKSFMFCVCFVFVSRVCFVSVSFLFRSFRFFFVFMSFLFRLCFVFVSFFSRFCFVFFSFFSVFFSFGFLPTLIVIWRGHE